MNHKNSKNACDCGGQMNRLQTIDFALAEVILYLDSYPECCEALTLYHDLIAKREKAVCEYENACGPITCSGNQSVSAWNWTDSPWPWELNFPGNCGWRRKEK